MPPARSPLIRRAKTPLAWLAPVAIPKTKLRLPSPAWFAVDDLHGNDVQLQGRPRHGLRSGTNDTEGKRAGGGYGGRGCQDQLLAETQVSRKSIPHDALDPFLEFPATRATMKLPKLVRKILARIFALIPTL